MLKMYFMRTNPRLDTSHHGPPHIFKDAGAGAGSLTGILTYDGEVPLHCQEELHTQGFLDIPADKYREDSSTAGVKAV
jgi:hypothetical protein